MVVANQGSDDEYVPVIRRERDAVLINRLANQPGLMPSRYYAGHDYDFTPAVRGCVILSNGEDAAMVFEQTGSERAWQVCTIYGDTCRGKKALTVGRAMKAWMMPKYADVVFGPVPKELPGAAWFYRQMGGRITDKVTINGEDYVSPNNDEVLFVLEAA